jgi:elongation factor Ts
MAHKIHLNAIKAYREKTNASINEVKQALEAAARSCPASASGGPACHCESKAAQVLRERGAQFAEKRQERTAAEGRVESYSHHNGRLAVLVEINCETDFVANTPEFAQFCKDVAMQVAAMSPRYVRREEAPADGDLSAEELKAACLLEQPFVKDASQTIGDLLKALIAKTGENVVIRRFARFAVGEST